MPAKTSPKEPAKKRKKQALGKGLGALIPDMGLAAAEDRDFFYCDINQIRPNPYQPRRRFSEAELAELANSIREQGVLQPLLVRKAEQGYELIAGERRLRAAKQAGLAEVPVVAKAVGDDKLLEISIVENIQRENLNPIEESEAYHRLITQFNLTQDQAADRVGKSRSAVANFLRLRQLPDPIKSSITEKRISMGHARALLGAENASQQLTVCRTIERQRLSVRETEALVRRLKNEKKRPRVAPKSSDQIYFSSLADELSRNFGTKVSIRRAGKKGRVEIEFYSDDDLDRLIGRLRQSR
jgi:ParB family chromosome partitioning protein